MPSKPLHVVVIGAGAFGGWTALHLRRAGCRVGLLDAWGPGNSRSSSGGDSRVIRAIYGGVREYILMVARSFELWREHEAKVRTTLYQRTGALWLFSADDGFARSSLPLLGEMGMPVQELTLAETTARYPQFDLDGVRSAFLEKEAGRLMARRACESVCEAAVREGVEFALADAMPGQIGGGRMAHVRSRDGYEIAADAFVFACGPWLGRLFPDAIGERIRPTRQDDFFFGTPAGDARLTDASLPVWLDVGAERMYYGIPGNDYRGLKFADDTRGDPIDPTTLDRTAAPTELTRVRAALARRVPAMANAPVLETRVCQYEQTPDGDFILDRHPGADNVWLAGGGSGHGFKVGPAVGEHVAHLVLGRAHPIPRFSLGRFAAASGRQ